MAEKYEKKVLGKIRFLNDDHTILEKDGIYEIFSESTTGVQVYIKTGFVGVPVNTYEKIKG